MHDIVSFIISYPSEIKEFVDYEKQSAVQN